MISISFPIKFSPYKFIPGTLSAKGSIGELGLSVGKGLVCAIDGVADLVELDQEGYVVCHWPLSYGVFEAEGVEAVLMKTAVESVIVGAYEFDSETALWLLDEVGIEYEVLLAEMLAEVFMGGITELEGAGMLILVAAALV